QVNFHFGNARQITAEELEGDGPLPDSYVYDFFLSSDADILRVGNVFVELFSGSGQLYNSPLGSNTAPPNPTFVAVFPALGADSWITTPGSVTATAGGSLGDDNASWFDTSDDGPQQNFHFARLTADGVGAFRGVVSVAGANGPESFPFNIIFSPPIMPFPEPTSLALFAIGLLSFAGNRCRGIGN
ncbi:MAG: PEP-CTERM sorting domain-containing protein, partial [Lacipirellulaceae bacterium]